MGFKRVVTLGDHDQHGISVALWCRECRRYAEIDAKLLLKHGARALPESLPFRCSCCGASGKGLAFGAEARRLWSLRRRTQD